MAGGGNLSFIPSEYFGLSGLGDALAQFGQSEQSRKARNRQLDMQAEAGERDQQRLELETKTADRNHNLNLVRAMNLTDPRQSIQALQNLNAISDSFSIDMTPQERNEAMQAEIAGRGLEAMMASLRGEEVDQTALSLGQQMMGYDPNLMKQGRLFDLEIEGIEQQRLEDLQFGLLHKELYGVELSPEHAALWSQLSSDEVARRQMETNIRGMALGQEIERAQFDEWASLAHLRYKAMEGEIELTEAQINRLNAELNVEKNANIPPYVFEEGMNVMEKIRLRNPGVEIGVHDIAEVVMNGRHSAGTEMTQIIQQGMSDIAEDNRAAEERALRKVDAESLQAIVGVVSEMGNVSDEDLMGLLAHTIEVSAPGLEVGIEENTNGLWPGRPAGLTLSLNDAEAIAGYVRREALGGPDRTVAPDSGVGLSASQLNTVLDGFQSQFETPQAALEAIQSEAGAEYMMQTEGFTRGEYDALVRGLTARAGGEVDAPAGEARPDSATSGVFEMPDTREHDAAVLASIRNWTQGSEGEGVLPSTRTSSRRPDNRPLGQRADDAFTGALSSVRDAVTGIGGSGEGPGAGEAIGAVASEVGGFLGEQWKEFGIWARDKNVEMPPGEAFRELSRRVNQGTIEATRRLAETPMHPTAVGRGLDNSAARGRERPAESVEAEADSGPGAFSRGMRRLAETPIYPNAAGRRGRLSDRGQALSNVLDTVPRIPVTVDGKTRSQEEVSAEVTERIMEIATQAGMNITERESPKEFKNRINAYNKAAQTYITAYDNNLVMPSVRGENELARLDNLIQMLGGRVPVKTEGSWYR